jgi:hypothetical protein
MTLPQVIVMVKTIQMMKSSLLKNCIKEKEKIKVKVLNKIFSAYSKKERVIINKVYKLFFFFREKRKNRKSLKSKKESACKFILILIFIILEYKLSFLIKRKFEK